MYMNILILLVSLGLLVFLSYQLYIRMQLERVEPDSPQMKRKIIFYKNQENNRLVLFLMFTAILFCLLFLGVLYNQYQLEQRQKDLEHKIEEVSYASGYSVESYQDNALKLAEFPWKKVVESRDAQALTNYEIQLSKEWQPFLGETSVTILKSQNTKSLTISVFSAGLTFENFKTAEKNIEPFIKELTNANEIKMIDFNFTYRNEENTLSKMTTVYSRASDEAKLEKVQLDK